MTAQSDGDIEELDDDSSKLIFAVLTNNVLSRAHQETRIPGVTVGVPIPAVIDTPEGSRN
jgi:hypothetical protein